MRKFLLILLLFPTTLFASEFQWVEYDTAEKKDIGLDARIKYPVGFSAQEGRRPHILGKFQAEIKCNLIQLMLEGHKINFKKTYGISLSKLTKRDLIKFGVVAQKEFAEEMFSNSKTIANSIIPTKIEGYPAVLFDIAGVGTRAGLSSYNNINVALILTNTYLISLTCGTGSIVDRKEHVEVMHLAVKKLICQPYFNSLLLMDKYRN